MSQAPSPGHSAFRLRLLGLPAVLGASGEPVPGLGPGKPLALLAYLAVAGQATRENIVTLLWGDVPEARARNAFRQTLHRLRAALGEDILPPQAGSLQLASARITTDVADFESAIRSGRLAEAVSLYNGEFLAGLNVGAPAFSEWADDQRQRLAARYRTAVGRGAEEALDAGDAARAADLAQSLTELAPLDSEAAVLEATALVAAGRRAEAIAALTLHTRRVQTELGRAADAPVTKMLARLMRSGDGPDAGISGRPPSERIPFVGRQREIATLVAAWRDAARGAGQTILVSGPEGIGKSRLVEELIERVRSLGPVTILRGRESSSTSGVAYGSIAEALRNVAEAPGVAGASQHLLAEAARLLPQLKDKFHLPEPGPITDAAERVRFYEGVAALLDALAYERPLLLLIEDLDGADEATLSLLRYAANRLASVAALIVLTARSATRVNVPGEILALEPLDEGEALDLLDRALDAEHPTPEERRRLAALSGGVPYRLLDLAERAVAAEVPTAAPVRLRDVMLRRLQRCTPQQQRVFVASALLARPVSIRLLAAAAHLSESAAFDAILELERKGLVEQRDDGVEPANALVSELALESTGTAGVALLAGWAADALARAPHARPAELARLYLLAGRREQVHAHAFDAAWEAAIVGATEPAQKYAQLAVDTAGNSEARARAETLLRTLGGGARRLAGTGEELPAAASASNASARPAKASAADEQAVPRTGRGETVAAMFRPPARWRIRPQIAVAGAAVLLLAGAIRFTLAERGPGPGATMTDTLVVAERLPEGELRHFEISGSLLPVPTLVRQRTPRADADLAEGWSTPWANPLVSPAGDRVAVEYVTAAGTGLFIISADRRDTAVVASGRGDAIGAGWSPDGAWILALHGRTDPAGEYHTSLMAHAASDPRRMIAFDTAGGSAVVDAAWSPRGDRVAWVARVGVERQQEIFVSAADGAERLNASNHPAEDFQIAWAPDGERFVFISERDDGPEIYAYDFATNELRRLTFDLAPKNQLAFSPDGRFLAYESTRDGVATVYLMPSWAGVARPVAAGGQRLSLVGWRGERAGFADRVRVRAPVSIAPGRVAQVTAEVTDATGAELQGTAVRWVSLDPGVAAIRVPDAGTSQTAVMAADVVGRSAGLARLVADLSGWRADTFFIRVAPSTGVVLSSFAGGSLQGWRVSGPAPGPSSDRPGADGVTLSGAGRTTTTLVSESTVAFAAGAMLRIRVRAPFASPVALPAAFTVAFAAAEPARVERRQEQRRVIASVEWRGESARLAYTADSEVATEPTTGITSGVHEFVIRIENDGRAAFFLDGRLRRRSTVRLVEPGEEQLVQVLIAGRGDRDAIVVESIEAGRVR